MLGEGNETNDVSRLTKINCDLNMVMAILVLF